MKVLHICLTSPYTDGWNYQENMLTKYQALNGHKVSVIASQWKWGTNGVIEINQSTIYINNEGTKIYRLPIKGGRDVFYRYKRFERLYETIEMIKPDYIFVHNLQFFDIDNICKYAKANTVRIYIDNHADIFNSARNMISRLFYKTVWRHYAKLIEPHTTKFYGVLPVRVSFLKDIYKLPEEKCELLVMGADDDEVDKTNNSASQEKLRKFFGFDSNDFVIVTGGKFNSWKKQIILLMEAIDNMDNPRVKLLIFGSVAQEMKEEFNRRCIHDKIVYAGWTSSEQSYQYFAIADLVVFPGSHSVYWEQAAGQGKPMMCKYWDGMTHIDFGGNIIFLYQDSVEEIEYNVKELLENPDKYAKMKRIAANHKEYFSYRLIAAKAIEEQ